MDNNKKNICKELSLNEMHDLKGFKIIHLNIRSLMQEIDSVRLDILQHDLDILCLSETWLHEKI